MIDMHNQVRQSELALEKKWVTQCGYFRLATTLIGISVVDCWKLAMYHDKITQDSMSIVKFAGVLGLQLVNYGKALPADDDTTEDQSGVHPRVISVSDRSLTSPMSGVTSALYSQQGEAVRVLVDANGYQHPQYQFKITVSKKGKSHCLTRWCKICEKGSSSGRGKCTSFYCGFCCKPYCCPTGRINRDCFLVHVHEAGGDSQSGQVRMATRGVLVAGAGVVQADEA
jgi:hypothetical protein